MTSASATLAPSLGREFGDFFRAAKAPPSRTITQFAEQELWLPPGGPFGGQKFSFERQPWSWHWCQLIDSGLYSRFALVKPGQVGGSLLGFNLPLLYHLCERGENTGCGVVNEDMAWDKWSDDIEPIIAASQYRDLIPMSGRGSKGGKFNAITLKNGATLKFMSAGGSDKNRAGKTLRALVVTETDGFDDIREKSREGDPITQMEGRLNAFGLMAARVYMECTASIPTGRIWKEWTNGLAATLRLQCAHCQEYVLLEREHLMGWQKAPNEVVAMAEGHFICPKCGLPWTEEQRRRANHSAVLVCKGQEIDKTGKITGSRPQTITASLRVSAVNNLLRTAGDVAWKEWKAKFAPNNEESNLKSLLQFTWAMPWSGESNSTGITPEIVASRINGVPRGVVPWDCDTVVCQIDMHIRWHYWVVLAGGRYRNPLYQPNPMYQPQSTNPAGKPAQTPDGKPIPEFLPPFYSVIDYGLSWNPDRAKLGPERSMMLGLEQLADDLESRQYLRQSLSPVDDMMISNMIPMELDIGMIDGGFHQEIAVAFATSRGWPWRVAKGHGRRGDRDTRQYRQPKERTPNCVPGDHWFDSKQPPCDEADRKPWWLVVADTNYWMHQVHGGYLALPYVDLDKDGTNPRPLRRPGSITLFGDDPDEHARNVDSSVHRSIYGSQICGWIWAEQKTKQKGQQIGWNKQWEEDHWLDCTYVAQVADSVARTYLPRFRPKPVVPKSVPKPITPLMGHDGRPLLVSDR